MKKLHFACYILLFALLVSTGCEKKGIDDDTSFVTNTNSGELNAKVVVTTDNSGNITFTPLGTGFSKFTVDYGDGSAPGEILAGANEVHTFVNEGSFSATLTGYDIAGRPTTTAVPISLTFRAPENLTVNINADMSLSATADYAHSFLVYYGDVANETPTPMALDETLPGHIYPNGGPYTLTVIAQSGGAATTTYIKKLFSFPIDFEDPDIDWFFGTFGNVIFSKVANPAPSGLNTSATVGKYEKPSNGETWSGTYSPLNIPMNLTYGNKVKVLLYNPDPANIGKMLNVELEAAVPGTGATPNGTGVLKIPITTSGAWEELVFDFSTIVAIGPNARFNQLVLRFNDVAMGSGETIYLDNFRLTF